VYSAFGKSLWLTPNTIKNELFNIAEKGEMHREIIERAIGHYGTIKDK
jgi:hypothetical protein